MGTSASGHLVRRWRDDSSLAGLLRELRVRSPRFVEPWESSEPDPGQAMRRHEIVEHPTVGRIALDRDTLVVAVDDLRLVVDTAAPGTEDPERLTLAIVLGTETLVG